MIVLALSEIAFLFESSFKKQEKDGGQCSQITPIISGLFYTAKQQLGISNSF